MFNQTSKNHINQFNLVSSQYTQKRLNNSSLIQNKSPLRQRENINANTSYRVNNGKKSISPVRTHKNQSYSGSGRNTLTKPKTPEHECENHNTKIAKFYVESQTELLYYCENCAVRLASQGFTTFRINSNETVRQREKSKQKKQNSRLREVNQFLGILENTIGCLRQKKMYIDAEIEKSENKLNEQVIKIQEYYSQFYQLIDEHKGRVVEELKNEYQNSCQRVRVHRQRVEDALINSQNMKKDINQSINQVILQAQQQEFRPVMNLYKSNLAQCKSIFAEQTIGQIKVKSLKFKGCEEAVCERLLEELVVEWDEEQSLNYQTELSQRENQVSYDSKQGKNHLKQLGQLFTSFEQ